MEKRKEEQEEFIDIFGWYKVTDKLPEERVFVDIIAFIMGITKWEMRQTNSRKQEIVNAHYLHMYVMNQLYGWNQVDSAKIYLRSHANYIHGRNNIHNYLTTDKKYLIDTLPIWKIFKAHGASFHEDFPIDLVAKYI